MKVLDTDSDEVRAIKQDYNRVVSETMSLRTQLKEQQTKTTSLYVGKTHFFARLTTSS